MSARPHLEAFEPRLLYSADALSLAMSLGTGGFATTEAAWTQAVATAATAATAAIATTPDAVTTQAAVTIQGVEIVVLDTSVADSASLLNDLLAQQRAGRHLEVLTLSAGEDGIARITELLAQRNNISALHVLGHGADGLVLLGGSQLNSATLLARAGEIATWGRAFSADADFLIYGCDVAAGAVGQQLINDLASVTGCDVAASTDTTASSLRGGNWVLEDQTGKIETALAVSGAQQQNFSGSLATIAVTRFTDDNNPGSLRYAITQANVARSADTITLAAGTYVLNLSNGVDDNSSRDFDISSDVTIVGAGAGLTVIESQGSWRQFEVSSGTLNLSGVTLRGGSQTSTDTSNQESRGGAINVHAGATLVLSQSVIKNSSAQNGGAIYVSGTATLIDVELRDNAARNDGGSLYNAGSTSLSRVTIANNTATKNGGGIYQTGSNLMSLVNLTLSGNRALEKGGGLYADAATTLQNVSVVNNAAGESGGGVHVSSNSYFVGVINSLFSGNVDAVNNPAHSNRQLVSGGNNLISDQGGVLTASSDRNVSDIQLGALANNGGVGRTHALLASSPAINAANSALAPNADQRGMARQGTADIGAFEYLNAAPTLTNVSLTLAGGGVAAPIMDANDAENDNITVRVVSVTGGYFARSSNLGVAITSFAGSDPQAGLIRFVHTGSVAPTFSLRAGDALHAGTAVTGTVFFTPANRAPVQSGSSLSFGSMLEDAAAPLTITQAQLLAGATDADGDPLGALNLRLSTASSSSGTLTTVGANTNAAAGLGGGLKAEYFNNIGLTGPVALTRLEAIDFNWGNDAPDPALPADNFSVRWTGFVVPTSSGAFTFRTESDDSIKVWVNGNLIIDLWTDHSVQADVSNPINLTAGTAYAVKVEYYEKTNVSTARLQWQTPGSSTYSAIPAARLFDLAPPAPSDLTKWTYKPAANYNGPVNFAFEMSDGRGGLVTRSATLAVTPVNDAPTLVTNTLTLSESGTVVPQILANDVDNPSASTLTFTATNITHGSFRLTSAPAVVVTQFTQQQINDGVVRFVHDGSNSAPSYKLRVSDGLLSSALSTAQISFTPLNDVPVFVTNTLNISNGGTATPSIVVTDEESTAAQLTLSVSALSGGHFELNSAPGTAITVFTQAQVNAGSVLFIHDGAFVQPSYRLTVTDPQNASAFKDVVVVFDDTNRAPRFLINTLALSEDQSVIVTNSQIKTTDADDNNSRLTISVSDLNGGFFAFIAAPTAPISNFKQVDIDNSQVRFVHDGSNNAPSYTLTVSDPGGLQATSVAAVTFTAINDAPVLNLNTLSITQGGNAIPNIDASDEDSTPAQLTFTVSNLSGGRFELIADAGQAITAFTQAQIDANEVRFVDAGSGTPPAYTLTVSDGALSSQPSNVNILKFVAPPVFTQNSLTVSEGGSATPGIAISDANNIPSELLITVTGLSGGRFERMGPVIGPVTPGGIGFSVEEGVNSFTLADLNADLIRFVHDGSEQAPAYTLTVTDSDGASDTSVLSNVVFTPVNDLPLFETNTLEISEGGVAVPNIKVIDADNAPTEISIYVNSVSGGRFELTSNAGQAITSFTQSQIDNRQVQFVDSGQGTKPTYILAATDPALRQSSNDENLPASEGKVFFTAVNDAPVFTSNSLTVTEGGVATPLISVTDEDNSAAQITITVSNLRGGRFESTSAAGVVITSFTQADLNASSVRFVHDGSGAAPGYTLTATDSDGAQSSSTLREVNFTAVNDKPVFTLNELTVTEGGVAIPAVQVSDEDNSPAELRISASAVVGGRFELTSAPGVAITQFTQAELNAGTVRFVHDGSETRPGYTLTATDSDGAQSSSTLREVNFTAVNDKPVFALNELTVTEGGVAIPAVQVTDEDNSPAELRISARAVVGGRFESTSAPGVAITRFTQAELNAGTVRFVHDGSDTRPGYALSVSDVEGAQATSAGLDLRYTQVNDAPVILSNQLRITEAGAAVPNIKTTDVDTAAAQLKFTVSAVSSGYFELASAPGVRILTFTQAQLDANAIRFVHDGSFNAPSYSLALSDGDTVLNSVASVSFTRLPLPLPAAVVSTTNAGTPNTSTNSSTPTATNSSTTSTTNTAKPTSASAADVLASRAAAAELAAGKVAAEVAATEAQAQAQAQGLTSARTTAQTTAASNNSANDARDGGLRGTASASTNYAGPGSEADARWATATVAAGSVNVQTLLLGGDANSLDWSSSSSSLQDRKLLDAVLGSSDSAVRNTALDKAFERIREELDQGTQADGQAVAGSLVLSTSFSVGYVLWLARGGVLLASMASSIPAWATVDPLPVLSRFKARQANDDDGLGGANGEPNAEKADALERLFSKAKKVFAGSDNATAPAPANAVPTPIAATPVHTVAHANQAANQAASQASSQASGVTP